MKAKGLNLNHLLFFLIAATAIRLYYISFGFLSSPEFLFFDEAQYWTWSKNLDLGYYSKPPMIGWLIAAFTSVCGDSIFCIKLPSPILHFFTALVVYLIGRDLYDKQTGIWASLIYITLPGTSLSSSFISTDSLLMFFWALGLYFFIRAVKSKDILDWILVGVFCGLGLMSKYTISIFAIAALAFIILNSKNIYILKSIGIWVGALIAFIIFLPNLAWNFSNDFISFSHTGENVFSGGFSLYPMKMLEFIGAQFFVFSPILFPALFVCAYKMIKKGEDKNSIDFYFTFVLLDIAILVSLISGAQAHWGAPAYIAGSVLIANFLKNRLGLIKLTLVLHIIIAAIFYNLHLIPLEKDPFARVKMWNIAALKANSIAQDFPGAVFLSDERKMVASLQYHLDNGREAVKWNADRIPHDYYDMTTDMNNYQGRNFILVTRSPSISHIAEYFKDSREIFQVDTTRKTFSIYHLKNFRGY